MPIRSGSTLGHLAAAVVDVLVDRPAVAGGPTVLRGDDDVALGHQLADDVQVVGVKVGVHPAVRQDEQRELVLAEVGAGREQVAVELDRVAGADTGRVELLPAWRAVDPDLLDHGHVSQAVEPQEIALQPPRAVTGRHR
jgi:hypothetical protein